MIFHQVLEGDDWKTLHALIIGRCLDGQCYEFAAALQRLTGWSLWALRTHEHHMRHVLVRDSEGTLWDARGPLRDAREIGWPFGVREPYDLREITFEEMTQVRLVEEHAIEACALVIEVLWPNLVRCDSRLRRQEAFVRDLEELSRKHNIWIRAPAEAQHVWPALAEGIGGETGYTMAPTLDANAYYINRRFR
ncbi:hypothetical protein KBC55_01655 [Patescibacteria group bacterium]|nr:hypothetical protein [Patescibacteria group bacterium]